MIPRKHCVVPTLFLCLRCFYFDGPAYSKYPDETIALETRWISILAMIRIPEAKKDNWSVM
jgi:hypothetical protein